MAKYLRPRRGTKTNAIGQNILLKRGEIFLEFQGDTIGNSRGKLIEGDGNTSYSNITPFIEDTSLYIPKYTEYSSLSSTEAINIIGDGSSAATATLPNIVAATKQALKKIADKSNDNYNAATSKANTNWFSSTNNGLCLPLENNTSRYLRADAQWREPPNDNTTYAVADFENAGLLPKLNGSSALFLRASRTWAAVPDTTYDLATTASAGLVRQLPSDATSLTKFLAADGQWRVLANGYRLTSNYNYNNTTLVANTEASYEAYKDLTNNLFARKTISMSISSVPAQGLGTTWAAATMSGYHPIAIIGYNTGSSVLLVVTLLLESKNSVSGVTFAVRNYSSARSASLTADVLFIRNSV
jgi:hypothetical protein